MTDTRRLTETEIGMYNAIQELKRRIAELDAGECVWTETRGTHAWKTSCDEMFGLWGDTLKENQYHFCPNCGKRIREIPLGNTETEQENTR